MFLKTVLTFLVVGSLSVNAMTTPVARSPTPEPESQERGAWMLKRDLSYDLFSRELQALDELFSREPENWAEWAEYMAKREPGPTDSNKNRPKLVRQPSYHPLNPAGGT